MNPRDAVQAILFLMMLAICLFTFVYPWRFRTKRSRVLIHLPLLLALLDFAYAKVADPALMDMRFDLLMLWPAFLLVAACYGVKLLLLHRSRSQDDRAA